MDGRQPRVESLCQSDKRVRIGGQSAAQCLEQSNPDGQLDEHGAKTAQRIYACLAIELHRLLGGAPPVVGVAFLYLAYAGLQGAHGAHLAGLLQGEGQGHQAYEDSEDNDGQPELIEEHEIQQREAIDHRVDDEEAEYVSYKSHRPALRCRVQRPELLQGISREPQGPYRAIFFAQEELPAHAHQRGFDP